MSTLIEAREKGAQKAKKMDFAKTKTDIQVSPIHNTPPRFKKNTEKDGWGVVAEFFIKILLYAQLREKNFRAFGAEYKEQKL